MAELILRNTIVRDQSFSDHPLRQIIGTLLLVTLGPDHGYTIAECGMRPRLTCRFQYRSLAGCFEELAQMAGCTWHVDVVRVLRFLVDDR